MCYTKMTKMLVQIVVTFDFNTINRFYKNIV